MLSGGQPPLSSPFLSPHLFQQLSNPALGEGRPGDKLPDTKPAPFSTTGIQVLASGQAVENCHHAANAQTVSPDAELCRDVQQGEEAQGDRKELEASVDAKIDQELMELATVCFPTLCLPLPTG